MLYSGTRTYAHVIRHVLFFTTDDSNRFTVSKCVSVLTGIICRLANSLLRTKQAMLATQATCR